MADRRPGPGSSPRTGCGPSPTVARFLQRLQDKPFNTTQFAGILILVVSGGILLLITGLTLTAGVLGLIFFAPLILLLSPIWVPVGAFLVIAAIGLLAAGGIGVAAVAGGLWAYRYVRGRHPVGSDRVDYARSRIADTASHVKDFAKEYGGYVQSKISYSISSCQKGVAPLLLWQSSVGSLLLLRRSLSIPQAVLPFSKETAGAPLLLRWSPSSFSLAILKRFHQAVSSCRPPLLQASKRWSPSSSTIHQRSSQSSSAIRRRSSPSPINDNIFFQGSSKASSSSDGHKWSTKGPCYVVYEGRVPGIYMSWPEVNAQVSGYSHNCYEKYSTFTEASEKFLEFQLKKETVGRHCTNTVDKKNRSYCYAMMKVMIVCAIIWLVVSYILKLGKGVLRT